MGRVGGGSGAAVHPVDSLEARRQEARQERVTSEQIRNCWQPKIVIVATVTAEQKWNLCLRLVNAPGPNLCA